MLRTMYVQRYMILDETVFLHAHVPSLCLPSRQKTNKTENPEYSINNIENNLFVLGLVLRLTPGGVLGEVIGTGPL